MGCARPLAAAVAASATDTTARRTVAATPAAFKAASLSMDLHSMAYGQHMGGVKCTGGTEV
jgi:hypothetical protein